MSDLTQQVLDHLDASSVAAIAARLGVEPAQAQAAIQQAVPLLVGSLAHNASTDAGANALYSAAADHAGFDLGALLGNVLGAGGGSILGHVFGGRQDQAAQGLGQASGLGTQNAGQLLAMLAPLIMGVLGNLSQKQGVNAGGLGGLLGQELQNLGQRGHGDLLGAVLGQGGGLGGLFKIGADLLGARGRA